MKITNSTLILFLSISTVHTFSQENDDTTLVNSKNYYSQIFVNAGVNLINYHAKTFFKYLYDNTPTSPGRIIQDNTNIISGGSITPTTFEYKSSNAGLSSSLGIEICSNKFYKINQLIELNWINLIGTYSYPVFYKAYNSGGGRFYQVYDTAKSKFTHNCISLGYKIQPNFKNFFLSLGIVPALNLIKVDEHKKEEIDTGFEFQTQITKSFTSYNTTKKFIFFNISLQLGGGMKIRVNKTVIKPTFYFTPFLQYNYNFYCLSLDILFGSRIN
jgi:hypothetical protein